MRNRQISIVVHSNHYNTLWVTLIRIKNMIQRFFSLNSLSLEGLNRDILIFLSISMVKGNKKRRGIRKSKTKSSLSYVNSVLRNVK